MQYAVSVALQGNHIVVLGDAIADDGDPRSFALARLGPNGFPDFSFGDPNIGGAVCPVAQMPRCATALSPAIASDLIHPVKLRVDPNEDRLVVAGEDASHEVAYLLRYTGDGDIDKVFPQVDFETIEGNPGRDIPNDFLILPDGAVVLTARVMTYSPNDPAPDIVQRLGIVKFTSEGLFDTKFSSSGMATYDLGPNNGQHPSRTGLSVARQGNGKFLIATSVKYGTLGSTVCRLLRIDSEGIEDPTLVDFGYPGVRDLPALNSEILSNDDADTTLFCTANRIIVDQDTIVVAGESVFSTTASTSSQDAFFYRLEERSLFSDRRPPDFE